jgi:hypothetical protein
MTSERRYHDDEIAEIFEVAASPAAPARTGSARGLTLAELQAIGSEVGLPPDRVAAAAASVDRSRGSSRGVGRGTTLGMPVATARSVELPRALSDREWALLVAQMRELFAARGRDASEGETRHWSNGSLHAIMEPTLQGYRLRLGTRKSNAAAINGLGLGGIALGVVIAGATAITGQPLPEFSGPIVLGAAGAGAVVLNALRLPRWVSTRERQFEQIIDTARRITGDEHADSASRSAAPADA